MNTKKRDISIMRLIVLIGAAAISINTVLADDLTPPTYRNGPLSVYAHWELIPGSTILNLTSWSTVDDADPSTTLYPAFTPTLQVQPDPAHQYDFQLPNWIDQMPIKYLRLQLTWQNTGQSPLNVFSEGLDGVNLINGQITYVSPVLPDASGVGAYQYYDIEFKPNPDFERVHVQMPADAVLSQVVIDTISTVPEPATLLLLSLGTLGVVKMRRA